ncbi:hypothetical protein BJ508DRAFT_325452 [Ascobolus immersus RN42]|uniref:Ankyrin n=1 Tax=Ascobolus immersus RN42 TaxID=1160509 RepID=A0A3N4I8P4_ASCIM|nr:hypothetical protein BJ508DRAFT_325452 [Ascobolus immersus RN42]
MPVSTQTSETHPVLKGSEAGGKPCSKPQISQEAFEALGRKLSDGGSLLHRLSEKACFGKNLDILSTMVYIGLDPLTKNIRQETFLHSFVRSITNCNGGQGCSVGTKSHVELLNSLLPFRELLPWDALSLQGQSLLHVAAEGKNFESCLDVLDKLIELNIGVDLNLSDTASRYTPLHYLLSNLAASHNLRSQKLLEKFLKRRGDLLNWNERSNKDGKTILHCAAEVSVAGKCEASESLRFMKLVLDRTVGNCHVTGYEALRLVDKYGKTPVHILISDLGETKDDTLSGLQELLYGRWDSMTGLMDWSIPERDFTDYEKQEVPVFDNESLKTVTKQQRHSILHLAAKRKTLKTSTDGRLMEVLLRLLRHRGLISDTNFEFIALKDQDNKSPLFHAVENHNTLAIKALLAAGADSNLNETYKVIHGSRLLRNTPLRQSAFQFACGRGSKDSVLVLLEAGGDIAAVSKQYSFTVLHLSAMSSHCDEDYGFVETIPRSLALLERVCAKTPSMVDAVDYKGFTAFGRLAMDACRSDSYGTCAFLEHKDEAEWDSYLKGDTYQRLIHTYMQACDPSSLNRNAPLHRLAEAGAGQRSSRFCSGDALFEHSLGFLKTILLLNLYPDCGKIDVDQISSLTGYVKAPTSNTALEILIHFNVKKMEKLDEKQQEWQRLHLECIRLLAEQCSLETLLRQHHAPSDPETAHESPLRFVLSELEDYESSLSDGEEYELDENENKLDEAEEHYKSIDRILREAEAEKRKRAVQL